MSGHGGSYVSRVISFRREDKAGVVEVRIRGSTLNLQILVQVVYAFRPRPRYEFPKGVNKPIRTVSSVKTTFNKLAEEIICDIPFNFVGYGGVDKLKENKRSSVRGYEFFGEDRLPVVDQVVRGLLGRRRGSTVVIEYRQGGNLTAIRAPQG